jgi:ABC-type transport system involved in cytochrome c biogenesis permease subunit
MSVDSFTISYSDMLQASATIIAGLLIFVTIAPLTRRYEILKRGAFILSTFASIIFFIASIVGLLFYPPIESTVYVVKVLFVIGLLGILATIIVLLYIDRLVDKLKTEKGQSGQGLKS